MASAERDAGFLSRWSRLKAQARREDAGAAEAAAVAAEAVPADPTPRPSAEAIPAGDAGAPAVSAAEPVDASADPPPLTLVDVAQLTRDSDFSPFIAADVKTEVKNAALKKLFSDPHFNVMDGLDVYIDDYNKPDPLPSGMLLKMAQAKFLGLVKQGAEELIADRPTPMNHGTVEVEPQRSGSATAPDTPPADKIASNENADLQLQPHDAAGRVHVNPGPCENGGRER